MTWFCMPSPSLVSKAFPRHVSDRFFPWHTGGAVVVVIGGGGGGGGEGVGDGVGDGVGGGVGDGVGADERKGSIQ